MSGEDAQTMEAEMMLYLVRHAQAKSKEEDPARPLSAAGVSEVESLAGILEGRGPITPAQIYHSGKTRARQTAEILARELAVREVLADEDALSPNADPRELDPLLEGARGDLMLVGHLPHMARLAGYLLEGDPDAEPVIFDTATAAALERGDREWRLRWSETGTA